MKRTNTDRSKFNWLNSGVLETKLQNRLGHVFTTQVTFRNDKLQELLQKGLQQLFTAYQLLQAETDLKAIQKNALHD